jgi:hypothetical protein
MMAIQSMLLFFLLCRQKFAYMYYLILVLSYKVTLKYKCLFHGLVTKIAQPSVLQSEHSPVLQGYMP